MTLAEQGGNVGEVEAEVCRVAGGEVATRSTGEEITAERTDGAGKGIRPEAQGRHKAKQVMKSLSFS